MQIYSCTITFKQIKELSSLFVRSLNYTLRSARIFVPNLSTRTSKQIPPSQYLNPLPPLITTQRTTNDVQRMMIPTNLPTAQRTAAKTRIQWIWRIVQVPQTLPPLILHHLEVEKIRVKTRRQYFPVGMAAAGKIALVRRRKISGTP